MNTTAKVKIWGQDVGAVAWNDNLGYASFEFYDNFLKKGLDLSPLKMSIEEVRTGKKIFSFPSLRNETYYGLPGLLADSLPDKFGNKIIEVWLARQGRNPDSFDSVERLCYTGIRGMGALEYEPALKIFKNESEHVEVKELVKLANDILQERKNLKTNIHKEIPKGLIQIIKIGTSAGGARAKAIIAYNKKTGDVRSGQIDNLNDYEYWIIKFDGVKDKDLGNPKGYGRIEYAYNLMAKDCGINMTNCKLLEENERAHFMTKRFDRDGVKKLHMQTLCAIAHFDYNDPTAYSYEQAFQTIRKLRLPYTDTEELYRRMVFNVIARNQDDHTKNISFLMDENGKWSLSPAYDVTFAYDPSRGWTKSHQMSINGKHNEILREDLVEVAKKMNIKKPENIINKIKEMVFSWEKYAKTTGVKKEQINYIKSTHILSI
jgi:serine/threonine-protein kinase HipA